MIEPYFQKNDIRIYYGDCLEIMSQLESVDLIFFSPPYNLGNFRKGSHWGKSEGERLVYLDHNDDMPKKEYMEWQHKILRSAYSLLNSNGAIFYNHKPRTYKGVWDDRRNLMPQDMSIRQEIVWDKRWMTNFGGTYYANATERIFILARRDWMPNHEYLGLGDVWRIAPEDSTLHPAPFPLELAKRVIVSASQEGSLVLDPMAGSFTTLVAAKRMNRKAIGIDISEKYCEVGAKRIDAIHFANTHPEHKKEGFFF